MDEKNYALEESRKWEKGAPYTKCYHLKIPLRHTQSKILE